MDAEKVMTSLQMAKKVKEDFEAKAKKRGTSLSELFRESAKCFIELDEKLEKTTKKHGIDTIEMLHRIVDLYLSFDNYVWELLGDFSRKSGLPIARISEAFILQELSREEAFQNIHGTPSGTFFLPFQGANIMKRGEDLATALIDHWEQIFQTVKDALENTPQLPISEMKEIVKEAYIQ